jgi:hypothetical protein
MFYEDVKVKAGETVSAWQWYMGVVMRVRRVEEGAGSKYLCSQPARSNRAEQSSS